MGWKLLLELVMVWVWVWLTAAASASDAIAKPDCPATCGNVGIPYPFGFRDGCSRDQFVLICNDTHYNPPKPFRGNYEILKISLEGQMRVRVPTGSDCYSKSQNSTGYDTRMTLRDDGAFTFSNTRNKFTAIGCDTAAYISGSSPREYTSGCVSICSKEKSVENGSCDGIGCCQTSIPPGAKNYNITVTSFNNHTNVMGFNPCSYAFLIDKDHFNFTVSDLSSNSTYKNRTKVPLVLDWAIGNETCESARRNVTSFACVSEDSICSNSSNGPGYRCSCSKGYRGNPYLKGGCKDIDECMERSHNCKGNCINTEGSFTCHCPDGTSGNATEYCRPNPNKSNSKLIKLILGSLFILLYMLAI